MNGENGINKRGVWDTDFRMMRNLINRLPEEKFRVTQAMAKATKCTASPITGMPGCAGGDGSQVERGVILIGLAKERYDADRYALDQMQKALCPLLEKITDPLEKRVMELRYMQEHSVVEVAYILGYSERRIFQLLRIAENKCQEYACPTKDFIDFS